MAANHDHKDASHGSTGSAMDYPEHDRTFSLFSDLIAWGTVGSVVILLFIGAVTSLIPWTLALVVSVLMAGIVAKFF